MKQEEATVVRLELTEMPIIDMFESAGEVNNAYAVIGVDDVYEFSDF